MAFIPHTKQASRDVRRRLVGCPAVLGGEGFFDARNGRAQCGEYLCGLSLYIGSEESESLKITLATCVILPVVWADGQLSRAMAANGAAAGTKRTAEDRSIDGRPVYACGARVFRSAVWS